MSMTTIRELTPPSDWNDAYSNMSYSRTGPQLAEQWPVRSEALWEALTIGGRAGVMHYAEKESSYCRWLKPSQDNQRPKGLLIFIHGGYWQAFSPRDFTYLAAGALARGLVVGLVGYPLCPSISMTGLVSHAAQGFEALAQEFADLPIILAGHSAGGQIITCLASRPEASPASVLPQITWPNLSRVRLLLSISGLPDLRPLLRTKMNEILKLNPKEAYDLSPICHEPDWSRLSGDVHLTAWVGSLERPEFLRQNQILPLLWQGLGMKTSIVEDADRDHFTVIEGLVDPYSPMMNHIMRFLGE